MKKKRSVTSKIVEKILHLTNKKLFDTAESAQSYMSQQLNQPKKSLKQQIKRYGDSVSVLNHQGMEVVVFGDYDQAEKIIWYLHGGAYVTPPVSLHFQFCNTLHKQLDVCVFMPLYKRAPAYQAHDAYDQMMSLYHTYLLKEGREWVLMGDSAGGGFALSFCEYLIQSNLSKLPAQMIVFSPWVDIALSTNHYNRYAEKDPILGVEGLREIGRTWSGKWSSLDPRVSPIYGKGTGFPSTYVFIGTHEIFYPDVIQYVDRLKKEGVDIQVEIGEEMNHVYAILPIPEGKVAVQTVIDLLS